MNGQRRTSSEVGEPATDSSPASAFLPVIVLCELGVVEQSYQDFLEVAAVRSGFS